MERRAASETEGGRGGGETADASGGDESGWRRRAEDEEEERSRAEDEEEEDEVMEVGPEEEEEEEEEGEERRGAEGGRGAGGRMEAMEADLDEEEEEEDDGEVMPHPAPLDLHTKMEPLSQDESSSDPNRSPPPEPIITLAEEDDEDEEERSGGQGDEGGERRVPAPSASPSSLSSASSCSSSSSLQVDPGATRRHHVHRHHRHRMSHKHQLHRLHQKHHRLSPHQEQLLAMAMEGGGAALNGGNALDAAKAAQINGAVAGMVTLQNLQNLQNLATLQGLPQVATLAAGLQGIAASLGPSSAAAAAAATQLVNAVASAAQSPLNLSVGSSGSVPTSCGPVSHDSNPLQQLQQQHMTANNAAAAAAAAISQQVLASQQNSGSPSPAATSMPQFILASGQLVQGIQGAQLLIPTSQGLATQTILTIPVNQVASGQVVNLALNNGQVVSTTLGNLQALAQPSQLLSSTANNTGAVPNTGLGIQHLLTNGSTPGVANQQHNQQAPQHQIPSMASTNVQQPPSLHQQPHPTQIPCVSVGMQRTSGSHTSMNNSNHPQTGQAMANPQTPLPISPSHHMPHAQQQQQQQNSTRNTSPQQLQSQAQQSHHQSQHQHHHYSSSVSEKNMNGSVSLSAISQRLSAANSSISITPTHAPHSTQSQHHHVGQQQQQQHSQHHHQNHQQHQQQSRHIHHSQDHHQSQHNHLMHKLHSALNGSGSHHKGSIDPLGDMPNQPTINQTTSNVVDGINLDEIKEFAKAFKLRRLSLGLTQTQVGQALSVTEGPAYSQSAICSALATQMYCAAQIASQHQAMFEKLDITPKSAQKIKPVLERWMKEAEERYKSGQHNLTEFIGVEPSKKRKRRTSFTPQALEVLNAHFERNTHPSGAEITALAQQLGYEREVIRIWFCNKRQALKNTVRMMSKSVVT